MAYADDPSTDPDMLRERAARYRELGASVDDLRARAAALELAERYDALADALERKDQERGEAANGAESGRSNHLAPPC